MPKNRAEWRAGGCGLRYEQLRPDTSAAPMHGIIRQLLKEDPEPLDPLTVDSRGDASFHRDVSYHALLRKGAGDYEYRL